MVAIHAQKFLPRQDQSSSSSDTTTPSPIATPTPQTRARVHPRTRLIVGAAIGSIVALTLLTTAVLLYRHYARMRLRTRPTRGTRRSTDQDEEEGGEGEEETIMKRGVLNLKESARLEKVLEEGQGGVGEGNMGRPASVYSTRPLSDPFAAEIKTIRSRGSDIALSPTIPTTSSISTTTPTSPLAHNAYSLPVVTVTSDNSDELSELQTSASGSGMAGSQSKRSRTASAELQHAMPELAGTFVASVRATAHSPPPGET